MDEHRERWLIASYYAWGRYDSGQRTLKTERIEPGHVERFAQTWAERQAALAAGEVVSAPGLLSAWDAWTHVWTVGREIRTCGTREAYWDDDEYPINPCNA